MVWEEWPKPQPQQMSPVHVLPLGKCYYRPWFKSYHKWQRTIHDWHSYLPIGVTFARKAKWTNHVERIFRKCVRLSLFAKKLRRLSAPAAVIGKFVEACVKPIILYRSSAIFSGLLKEDFALLRRSIELTSNVCCLSFLSFVCCWQWTPRARGIIKGKFTHLHQEPFKTASLKDSSLS